MIDVVTDISPSTTVVLPSDLLERTEPIRVAASPAQDLRDAFAQPAQMVALGMGLAYMETVAPNCCEGSNHS